MSAQRRTDDTHGRDGSRAYGDLPAFGAARSRARTSLALGAAAVLVAAILGLIALAVVGGEDTLVSALGGGVGAIALLAAVTLAWSLTTLRREHEALVRREADALRMAELDDLTGLGNYRRFMRQLTAEVARSRRYEDPFSLVLLDLDGFKAINDELGHLAGDDALRLVAVALRDALREEDVCCRQGGDEFAVIAVRAGQEEAQELAERLVRAIADIPFGAGGERRLGASVGWATFGEPARSVDELILRADAALRQTKRTNGGPWRDLPAASAASRGERARAGVGVAVGPSASTRLALLAGLARALPGARDERALAETTVAFLAGAFDTVGAAVVGLEAGEAGSVRIAALSSGDDHADVVAALADQPIAQRALAAAGPAVTDDDVERRWVDGARVRSELAVAIRDETRTWGWLTLVSDRTHAYDLSERALAEAIAEQLGRALTCRSLLDRLRGTGFGELYRVAVGSGVAVGSAAAAGTESWRIAELAWQTGRALQLADADLRALYLAALFHDVGTVGVPAVLLSHPGELRDEERAVLREHALIGERMLRGLPLLSEAAPIVRHEHERFDGTGYPDRLAGEQIPLAARILLACDAFVSMTSPRPWRPPRTALAAQAELRHVAGTQLDPRVVGALLGVLGAEQGGNRGPQVQAADPAAAQL
ncbi:MAG TPA: diguanylate cyclase [Conexibacter sp.]|jgi:diguanylate cyclase (GGDEF)-like protein|nr:diguanylate cyclase [Conexibacter sp.]